MSGKIIFITGGARSGKSSYAEKTASQSGEKVAYIATAVVTDGEMQSRIERHRQQRPASWRTFEAYRDLDRILGDVGDCRVVLLDCLTVMTTNIMMETDLEWEDISRETAEMVEKDIIHEIERFVAAARSYEGTVIVVSNELGMGLVPPYPLGRFFRDFVGRANQQMAGAADEVYFMVSGIPMRIK